MNFRHREADRQARIARIKRELAEGTYRPPRKRVVIPVQESDTHAEVVLVDTDFTLIDFVSFRKADSLN